VNDIVAPVAVVQRILRINGALDEEIVDRDPPAAIEQVADELRALLDRRRPQLAYREDAQRAESDGGR
jgi:hypothetical protein